MVTTMAARNTQDNGNRAKNKSATSTYSALQHYYNYRVCSSSDELGWRSLWDRMEESIGNNASAAGIDSMNRKANQRVEAGRLQNSVSSRLIIHSLRCRLSAGCVTSCQDKASHRSCCGKGQATPTGFHSRRRQSSFRRRLVLRPRQRGAVVFRRRAEPGILLRCTAWSARYLGPVAA